MHVYFRQLRSDSQELRPRFERITETHGGASNLEKERSVERKELMTRLMPLLAEIESHAGPAGMSAVREYASGNISSDDLEKKIEEAPDFKQFQEVGIALLEKQGFLEQHGAHIVVDLDKIYSIGDGFLSQNANALRQKFDSLCQNATNFLLNVFHKKQVVSREEWLLSLQENRVPQAKPLFYEPESAARAYNVDAIKQSQFHIGSWEIFGKKNSSLSQFSPDLDYDQVTVACMMYHPAYGNGQRDEKRNLVVRYEDGRERKISQQWFTKTGGQKHYGGSVNGNHQEKNSFFRSPKLFLQEGGWEDLQQAGLITIDDFEATGKSESVEKYGEKRVVAHPKGYVTLQGVRYALGTEYGNSQYVAYKISHSLGGLVRLGPQGEELGLSHTFTLVDTEDSRVHIDPTSQGRTFGKRQGLEINPYHEDGELFVRRNPDESEEDFRLRSEAIDFSLMQRIKHEVVQKTGVSLETLNPREQTSFVSFYRDASSEQKEELFHFIKVFKRNGLRTFLVVAENSDAHESVFTIQKKMDVADAARVYRDYGEVIDFADALYASIGPLLDKEQVKRASSRHFFAALLGRATHFLRYASQQAEKHPGVSHEQIVSDMQDQGRALDPSDCKDGVVSQAVIELVNILGDVRTRELLDEAAKQTKDGEIKASIETAYRFITPTVTDARITHDLVEFYQNFQIESYDVNQEMNVEELQLLEKETGQAREILDLGCGTGRLLIPLAGKGKVVHGLDYSQRHVDMIKQDHLAMDIRQGDWKNTPYQQGSFDVVYSLGRNILHEVQLPNQVALFKEVGRVLARDGVFIFDIPNRDVGGYRQRVDGYSDIMKKRGISRFREGTVYDSPDGKHFTTRYVYSHEDIVSLATDAGFIVERVEKKHLAHGNGDENLYYFLRKVD